MEKNTSIIIGLLILIIGFGGGYLAGGSQVPGQDEHMMRGGMMMGNNDMMGHGDMDGAMDGMMEGLQGKSGDEFDRAFLSGMIVHHEGAVAMAQAALQSAKHQEIKDMAKAIISAQTTEINQMKAWGKSWYNQ